MTDKITPLQALAELAASLDGYAGEAAASTIYGDDAKELDMLLRRHGYVLSYVGPEMAGNALRMSIDPAERQRGESYQGPKDEGDGW